jgi:type II secretory pathway pseudopilin PulG
MRTFSVSRQRGASLLETIVVIAMILMLSAIIIAALVGQQNDVKARRLIQSHVQLMQTITAATAGQSSFTAPGGVNWVTFLETGNMMPANLSLGVGSGQLRHAFGGSVTLAVSDFQGPLTGGTNPGLPLLVSTYTSLPNSACIRIVAMLAPKHYETLVNGTRVTLLNAPTYDAASVPQLSGLCTATNNTVVFRYMPTIAVPKYTVGPTTTTAWQNTLYTKLQAVRAQRAAWWP